MKIFKDGQYNSAQDKTRIYKAWVRFLESNLNPNRFTKDLYKDLSLHWGFIAHYNQSGFYSARFAEARGLSYTLEQIKKPTQWVFVDDNTSGNGDLHKAMHEIFMKSYLRLQQISVENRQAELKGIISKASSELALFRRA